MKEDKKSRVTYGGWRGRGGACISSSRTGSGGLNDCQGADVCCSHIKQQLVCKNKLQGYWFTLQLLSSLLLLSPFVCVCLCLCRNNILYMCVSLSVIVNMYLNLFCNFLVSCVFFVRMIFVVNSVCVCIHTSHCVYLCLSLCVHATV